MPIESNKSLGRVAAILSAIGSISAIAAIFESLFSGTSITSLSITGFIAIVSLLAFVGFIIYLIAMYGFSKDYAERKIFGHLETGLILTIVIGMIVGVITGAVFLLLTFQSHSITNQYSYITAVFSTVSIIWVYFNYKAINLLSQKSGVLMFRTAAKVLLAGALLTVALNISIVAISMFTSAAYSSFSIISVPGSLIQAAAWILLAKAYYQITPPAQTMQPYSFQPAPQQAKYCPNCGAQNPIQAIYCTNCGQKL